MICRIGSAKVAQLDAYRTDDQKFGSLTPAVLARQHSFVEIDHEIFPMAILSLLLIQEGQWLFLAKECAQYWLTA